MKVISFCLWGDNPKYNVGAIRNAELAQRLFPDWVCRFYIPAPLNQPDYKYPPAMDELSNLENVKIKLVPWEPGWAMMLARFRPISEDHVDVMISRDCDSRLSVREREAVDEWLASSKMFHTMHDHPHHSVPILGGMWGIKKGLFSELGRHAIEWAGVNESRWQVDQDFLTNIVWPIVKNDTLNHDEFFRHLWGGVPFPSKRDGLEFVGQVFNADETVVSEHQDMLRKYLR